MFKKYIVFLLAIAFISLVRVGYTSAGDQIIINGDAGGRLVQAAMYPQYVLFLKGGTTADQKANWVDKEYWASLDILEGEHKGKSVLFTLHPPRRGVTQPQWCYSGGGSKYVGRGITCLNEGTNKELRFKADIQWAVDAPDVFKDRDFAEYPNLPGKGGVEDLLDKVRFVISLD